MNWWVRMDSNHRACEDLVYSQTHSPALPHTQEKLASPARFERATSGFVDRRSDPAEPRRHETGGDRGARTHTPIAGPSVFKTAAASPRSAKVSANWYRRRGSNPRRPALEAGALPTELPRQTSGAPCGSRTRGFRLDRPALWPLSQRSMVKLSTRSLRSSRSAKRVMRVGSHCGCAPARVRGHGPRSALSRCTLRASPQRTSRPPLRFQGHVLGRCAEAHPQ